MVFRPCVFNKSYFFFPFFFVLGGGEGQALPVILLLAIKMLHYRQTRLQVCAVVNFRLMFRPCSQLIRAIVGLSGLPFCFRTSGAVSSG